MVPLAFEEHESNKRWCTAAVQIDRTLREKHKQMARRSDQEESRSASPPHPHPPPKPHEQTSDDKNELFHVNHLVTSLRLRRIHQIQQIIQAVLISARSTFRPCSAIDAAVAPASPPGVHTLLSSAPLVDVVVVVGEVKLPEHLGASRVARSEVDGDGAVAILIIASCVAFDEHW